MEPGKSTRNERSVDRGRILNSVYSPFPESEGITALLVDDEPDLVELVSAYLDEELDRFEARTATSVSEARSRLDASVDCIVSDYDMRKTDGIEFLEQVRREYPELPFILYTGKGSEAVASQAISAGATDYLQKDTGTHHYEVLANRVENAVSQYRNSLRASHAQRRLAELADVTDDVLWMFDGEWSRLLFVNAAYEEIWGRSIASLEENPRSFVDGIHPDDRPRVERAMADLTDGKTADVEYRVDVDDGGEREVWVKAYPITDASGAVVRIAGFVRDITGWTDGEHGESSETR